MHDDGHDDYSEDYYGDRRGYGEWGPRPSAPRGPRGWEARPPGPGLGEGRPDGRGPRGPRGGYPGRGPREEFGGRGPHERPRDRGARGPELGGFGAFFGPDGPFGPHGPFGPNGPFGANGPFGEDGPFGRRGPFGGAGGAGFAGPGQPGQDYPPGRRGHRGHRGGARGQRSGRARRGDVRLAILGLLAEEDRNGYQLIRALEERTGGAWRPSPGAIYPALAQLEDEGLIGPAEGGKKVFSLTDAGRAEVEQLGERARPWEGVAQDATTDAQEGLGGTAELWIALGQLGLATRAVGQAGDPDVTRAATELLEESRRGLYRLLAQDRADDLDDDDDDVDADVTDVAVDGPGDAGDPEVVEGELVEDVQDEIRYPEQPGRDDR